MNVKQLYGIFKLMDRFGFSVIGTIPKFTFLTKDANLKYSDSGLSIWESAPKNDMGLSHDECILNFHDSDNRHMLDINNSVLMRISILDGINAILLKALENDYKLNCDFVNALWIKKSFGHVRYEEHEMFIKDFNGLRIRDYKCSFENSKIVLRNRFIMDNLLSNWTNDSNGIKINMKIDECEEVFNFHIMLNGEDTIVKQISRKAPNVLPTVFIFKDYDKIPPAIINTAIDDILSGYYKFLEMEDQYALNCIEHSCQFNKSYLECAKYDSRIVVSDLNQNKLNYINWERLR